MSKCRMWTKKPLARKWILVQTPFSYYTLNLERKKENLMPTGRYLFIPFLRAKSQMSQTKNRPSKKSHKKDQQD